jgi:hypothetical protein
MTDRPRVHAINPSLLLPQQEDRHNDDSAGDRHACESNRHDLHLRGAGLSTPSDCPTSPYREGPNAAATSRCRTARIELVRTRGAVWSGRYPPPVARITWGWSRGHTPIDLRRKLLPAVNFRRIYAPGTRQNHQGRPGVYRFYLAHTWSTTLLEDGYYRLFPFTIACVGVGRTGAGRSSRWHAVALRRRAAPPHLGGAARLSGHGSTSVSREHRRSSDPYA